MHPRALNNGLPSSLMPTTYCGQHLRLVNPMTVLPRIFALCFASDTCPPRTPDSRSKSLAIRGLDPSIFLFLRGEIPRTNRSPQISRPGDPYYVNPYHVTLAYRAPDSAWCCIMPRRVASCCAASCCAALYYVSCRAASRRSVLCHSMQA